MTLNNRGLGRNKDNAFFTLGGMNCKFLFSTAFSWSRWRRTILASKADRVLETVGQDSVGGPPYVSVAMKDGEVVAVRLHAGFDVRKYNIT